MVNKGDNALFRPAALDNRLVQNLGTTRMQMPASFLFAGYAVLILLILMGCLIYFGKFSPTTRVRGFLDLDQGLISISAERAGIIRQILVKEGQYVKKGAMLFQIKNQDDQQGVQQVQAIGDQILALKRESQLKKSYYLTLKQLYHNKLISLAALNEAESTWLHLQNQLTQAHYELQTSQHALLNTISAPAEGVVTNLLYQNSQIIKKGALLAQIIPSQRVQVARLALPAKDMGFVQPGQMINLSFDAYPALQYGYFPARISEIGQAIVTDELDPKPLQVHQPYFRVKAILTKPIPRHARHQHIAHYGMPLTAVIQGTSKPVWRWILEPLARFKGGIQ